MNINDIKKKYDDFATNNRNIISDFSLCSLCGNKPNRYSFVNNKTGCINFDNVKDDIPLKRKSVDSLYLSMTKNRAYFIEFKDSRFSNVHEDIVDKAIDSTIIHHNICNFNEYKDNDIVCVLSSKKEISSSSLTNAMLRLSGYYTNASYLQDLEIRFKTAFNNESIINQPVFTYDNYKIIFDIMFDDFVNNIK